MDWLDQVERNNTAQRTQVLTVIYLGGIIPAKLE
jgi:hypothetical protein